MAEKKFCRVDKFLRVAVGVEMPSKPVTRLGRVVDIPKAPGVIEVLPCPKRDSVKVYLEPSHNEGIGYPDNIQVRVPAVLKEAPWGEILFSNTETGAQVLFGREGEEMPFGPAQGKYVVLRLYREKEHPFRPIYVRVDKGPETYFFVIRAQWQGDTIAIKIEREPATAGIPHFLN